MMNFEFSILYQFSEESFQNYSIKHILIGVFHISKTIGIITYLLAIKRNITNNRFITNITNDKNIYYK